MQLRDFAIGDTVKLAGALAWHQPLIIGDIDRDGRCQLWMSHEYKNAGQQWTVSAAGSHAVSNGGVA